MSNVSDAISKLKLKNSKNHFSILVLYLPAYSYAGIWMNEYVYSPMKAAHIHRDIKVYKIDRGQNYTQKRKNYIELTKQSLKTKLKAVLNYQSTFKFTKNSIKTDTATCMPIWNC